MIILQTQVLVGFESKNQGSNFMLCLEVWRERRVEGRSSREESRGE